MARIVGVSGSLGNPSRTRALVEEILSRAAKHGGGKTELIDIAEIAKDVGGAISYDQLPPVLVDAYRKLAGADLIVIGSPVYKASYTGLLKHFFDLIDPKQLAGKVAILSATGGSDQHASVLEYQLRPLTSFFGIVSAPTAIYARDTEFEKEQVESVKYRLNSDAISSRVDTAVGQALELVRRSEPVAWVA